MPSIRAWRAAITQQQLKGDDKERKEESNGPLEVIITEHFHTHTHASERARGEREKLIDDPLNELSSYPDTRVNISKYLQKSSCE
jgi:hypothetical protein